MKRSMPRMSAMPATGTDGTTESVAANVMKPAPVMPAAPLEESMATSSRRICSPKERWMPVACAMNRAASVM
ncbi:hypothetical protein D3C71_1809770 [compost metagenome]